MAQGDVVTTVTGNLTSPPELRFTPSGAAVINFTVASTTRVFDKQTSEYRDGDTLFMRCNLWRQAAENLSDTDLKAGARVIAMGRLKQRSFETKEGEKRTVVELEVDEVGPSLKYAKAVVTKVSKVSRGDSGDYSAPASSSITPADDPWGSAPAPAGGQDDDGQPPF